MRPIYIRSDFHVCPNPLSGDSYSICPHDCKYCFIRESYHTYMKQTFDRGLLPTSINELNQTLKTAFGTTKESSDPAVLALRAGLPVILGRKSEPFSETDDNNTIWILKTLHEYGVKVFPEAKDTNVQLPELAKYAEGVLISIMPAPWKYHELLEPGLPHPLYRFNFAQQLKEMGLFVGITGEPLLIPAPEGFYQEYAQKVAEVKADHVNFGEYRTNNPKLAYQRFKEAGVDLKPLVTNIKTNWHQMATSFVDSIRSAGTKCSSPDWVNFGLTNDCLGCCGLDSFGNHKFNFQYALRAIKEKGKVTFKDISQHNIFGEEYEKRFKEIWNTPKEYYGLQDVKGIGIIGIDSDGNKIYGLKKSLF